MSNNTYSPRKPIPTLRQVLNEEGYSIGTTTTTNLERRLESQSEIGTRQFDMTKSQPETIATEALEALEISTNFKIKYEDALNLLITEGKNRATELARNASNISTSFNIKPEEVLSFLQRNGQERTLTLAQETDHFAEDFKTAAQLVSIVGYERTISLMEHNTDLTGFKQMVDKKEVVPVIVPNLRKDGETYNVTYLLTKSFLESEKFRTTYKTPEHMKEIMQATKNEETINLLLERVAGAKVNYKGMVNGFCIINKANGTKNKERNESEIKDYTPITIGNNGTSTTYYLSEEFLQSRKLKSLYQDAEGLQMWLKNAEPQKIRKIIERLGGIIEKENGYMFVSPANNKKTRENGAFEIRRVGGKIVSVSDDGIMGLEDKLAKHGMQRLDKEKEHNLLDEGYRMDPLSAAHYESLVEMRTK
jgi:hypothetical protein